MGSEFHSIGFISKDWSNNCCCNEKSLTLQLILLKNSYSFFYENVHAYTQNTLYCLFLLVFGGKELFNFILVSLFLF